MKFINWEEVWKKSSMLFMHFDILISQVVPGLIQPISTSFMFFTVKCEQTINWSDCKIWDNYNM